MERSTSRILTTHTGSLPRPAELVKMFGQKSAGKAPDARALELEITAATDAIVRRQVECGIDIVNDGEASKSDYTTYVSERLEGFKGEGSFVSSADIADHPEFAKRFLSIEGFDSIKIPACNGPVAWKNREAVSQDIRRFKDALKGVAPVEAFMTCASPGVIAMFMENRYYENDREYLYALADVMRDEYTAIAAAGFLVQLDCPDLACGRHSRFADLTSAEFNKVVELHVEVINRAIAGIAPDRVRIHLCWGNYEGPHHHDVPLREIIEPVLHARVGAISIEAANPRHEHEWAVFKEVKLPKDKIIIPGVIDTSTNYIEHPELVAQRIVRFAEVVGPENVIAGCDCGFATFAATLAVVPSITWAKLGSLVEGAKRASATLYHH